MVNVLISVVTIFLCFLDTSVVLIFVHRYFMAIADLCTSIYILNIYIVIQIYIFTNFM